ncbi:MAG: MATE family efflux transporter [Leptospiraceae bacterium]|nr:MATE family efflux transporter [Leptospiraceae bacterium]
MISQTLIQVTDTLMVGRLGSEAIACAGLGGTTYFTIMVLLLNGSVGIQILTARRLGENNLSQVGKIATTAFYFSILAGLVITFLGIYSSHFFINLLNDNPQIVQKTTVYIQYRFWGTVFFFVSFGIRGFFDGIGQTYVGMFSSIFTMASNVFLNWVLIFGNLGFTPMGINGAAIASSISGSLGFLVCLPFLAQKEIRHYLQLAKFRYDVKALKNTLVVGFPSALDGLLTHTSFLFFNKMAGMISVYSLAATTILISILAVSFMPGYAFGIAATTILGQAVGKKKFILARIGTYRAAHYSALIMSVMGILFILFGRVIISFFSKEEIMLKETYPALVIVSLAQLGDAYNMVFGSALRSAGFVNWVLVAYFIASYLVMLPIAYLFGVYLDMGTLGLWFSIFVWLYLTAIIFVSKFNKGDWKSKEI